MPGKDTQHEDAVSLVPRRYARRAYRSLGTWSEGRWRLKAYGIHHRTNRRGDRLIDSPVLRAAREYVKSELAIIERKTPHYHVGFVVVHQGRTENWLLLNWWAYENVCCEVLWRSRDDRPERFVAVRSPMMACVYELTVIGFERRAWIDAMLGATPDRARYLEMRLADGLY